MSRFARAFGALLVLTLSIPAAAVTTPTPTATAIPATPTRTRVAAAATSGLIRVPQDVATLQTAIDQVPNGGIIEIAAGTYASPANGWSISDTSRAFTVRAASGATVVLDGGGARTILRFINSSLGAGRPVTFERLTFANGRTTTEGLAGGVTVQRAHATFVGCTFQDNRGDSPSTGGGGVQVALSSTAFFFDCVWDGNSAKNYGAGLALEELSTAYIHRGFFLGNRTNLPNHHPASGGAGIHVGNSTLRVANSRFEGNRAGYVGGAIYAIGSWADPVGTPRASVLVVNSTFVDNQAVRDASVSFNAPTEAGAVHIEDQATGRIINSRFLFNSAHTGGAANTYRGILEIERCHFEGNRATGSGAANGFGGAISAISNDAADATTNNGAINRRSASLTVRDSLIRGRSGAVTTAAQTAACIYSAGDDNRVYGLNGVSQMGSVASNRATVVLDRVALVDCDVQEVSGVSGSGIGGGMMTAMTTLTMQNSLVINSDALGSTNSGGGGMALIDNTAATITATTIARNTTSHYGGGVFVQGSQITLSNSNLLENEVSPGVNETVGTSYGAAIFTTPADGFNLPVSGTVSGTLISKNVGLPIFDDDRTNGPINDVRYDNNQIYSTTFGATVYSDSVGGFCCRTTAQLNTLVVTRSNGVSTTKSQVDNTALASAPNAGALLAVPPVILPTNAAGDAAPPTTSYLAYAWSGSSATLDGNAVGAGAGLTAASGTGSHVLAVGGTSFSDTVDLGATPAATFAANPTTINNGQSSTLSWATTAGAFLDAAIDQGVSISPTGSGSIGVSPSVTTLYRFLSITEDGGDSESATVTLRDSAPIIASFTTNPVLINPGASANLAWATSGASSATINGVTVGVPNGNIGVTPATTTMYTLSANSSFGTTTAAVRVNVNSGTASLAAPTITAPSSGQVLNIGGVSLAWDAVGGASNYDLRLWDGSTGLLIFQGSLSGNGSTSTLITLPSNGTYLFGVRACGSAVSDAQCGRFASRAFSISLTAPTGAPTVTAPSAGATLRSSIQTLQWTAVAGNGTQPVFYEVQLTNLTSGSTELQITVPHPTLSTITRVRSGNYSLRVRACQAGCGPWGASVAFTASIGSAPTAKPTITNATVSGGNSLAVAWTSVAGAEWYQVYVIQPPPAGPGNGALTVAAREIVGTSATIPVPAGQANIIVAGCTGNGCGPFSNATAINPGGPNPSAPTLGQPLAGSVVAGPTALFTWSRIPGDNGSNTVYRLFVQDLSRQAVAFDVWTTQNYYSAYFKAEGARYDALVVANPGPGQIVGPAVGFTVGGQSTVAPTMVQPAHNSTVPGGNVQLGWTPLPGASLYEYFVAVVGAQAASATGVTPGLVVQAPLLGVNNQATMYSGIVRACPAGASCAPGSDAGWGPWSNVAGTGVTNFTVSP